MAKKMKSRQSASQDYWERREKEALKQTRASEEEFAGKIGQVYKDMRKDINDRINRWYIRYANDSEIDITEAKKRVSKLDIEEYSELAKKYVALSRDEETRAQAFTDEANEQMKIYNLTMKVNRLENLKAQMGLDLCGGFSKLQKNYGEFLTDQMMKEFERQSGILGMTTTNPRRFRRQMEAIVNGSFHNATFSQRLWNHQDALKGELDRLLTRALIQGLNPRTVAPELKKKFDSSEQAADLLMITELCRVQTEAQKLSFQEFGYEDYTFICNGGACKECEALNGKHFKVKDMQAGRNAPPMHPRCRCSTAAYMDREKFEKWLEGQNKAGQSIGLSSSGSNQLVEPHDPPKFIRDVLDTEDRKKILSDYEKLIVDSPIENAIVITKDGKLYHCYGTLNGVYPDYDLGEELRGADMTHNHPVGSDNEYSFSESDRSLFFSYELHILRGIDELYEYEFNRDKDDVDEITGSAFDIDEYSFRHQKVIDEARLFGIGYRRKKRE